MKKIILSLLLIMIIPYYLKSQEKLKSDAQKTGFEIVKVNTELLERDNIYFLKVRK